MGRVPGMFGVAVLALIWPAFVFSESHVAAEKRPFPQLTLPGRAYGEQAIQALGAKLPEVAEIGRASCRERV